MANGKTRQRQNNTVHGGIARAIGLMYTLVKTECTQTPGGSFIGPRHMENTTSAMTTESLCGRVIDVLAQFCLIAQFFLSARNVCM